MVKTSNKKGSNLFVLYRNGYDSSSEEELGRCSNAVHTLA